MKNRLFGNLEENLKKCTSCNLCQLPCPLYQTSQKPSYSPAGIITAIAQSIKGNISASDALEILNRCLFCGKCEAECPARLPITEMFFFANLGLDKKKKSLKTGHKKIFPSPKILAYGILKTLKQQASLLANMHDAISLAIQKKKQKNRGIRILLFNGCSARQQPQIIKSCKKALKYHGFQLVSPDSLSCCGKSQDFTEKKLISSIRHTLHVFSKTNITHVLTPCPSCAHTIKKIWPQIAALNADEKMQTRNISEKTEYIGSFLANCKAKTRSGKGQKRILWHNACSLSAQDSQACRQLPGINTIFLSTDKCCGASHKIHTQNKSTGEQNGAGILKTTELNIYEKIGKKCRNQIAPDKPELVVTACPDCVIALNKRFTAEKDTFRAIHLMEYYCELLDY